MYKLDALALARRASENADFKSYDEIFGSKVKSNQTTESNFAEGRSVVGFWRNDLAFYMAGSSFHELQKDSGRGIEILRKEPPFVFGIPEGTSRADIELFLHLFLTVFSMQYAGRQAVNTAMRSVVTYVDGIEESKKRESVEGHGKPMEAEERRLYDTYRDQVLRVLTKLDDVAQRSGLPNVAC